MADAKRTCLIVTSVISAKNFPPRPECSLVVQAQFCKEVLSSDPVPFVEDKLKINTELAWEVSKKSLKQHKLNRTPIKLLCVAINNLTKKREDVGYVMLDLKTAKPKDGRQETSWYPVLNSSYANLKPHLQLCLTLEQALDEIKDKKETVDSSYLSLALHSTGDYFQLGPTDAAHQKAFLFSVTLQNPKNLPPLPDDEAGFHFHYNLFDNAIISELFVPPVFPSERSAIQIRTSRKLLSMFLGHLEDLVVSLCCGSSILGKGSILLNSLKDAEILSCSLLLGIGDASVDICVQVERFWVDAKTMSDVPAEIEGVMKTVGKKSKKNAAKKVGYASSNSQMVEASSTETTNNHLPSSADSQLPSSLSTRTQLKLKPFNVTIHSSRNLSPSSALPSSADPQLSSHIACSSHLKGESPHHKIYSSPSPTRFFSVDSELSSSKISKSTRSKHKYFHRNSSSPSRTPYKNESSPSPTPHQKEFYHKNRFPASSAKVAISPMALKKDFSDSSSSSNPVLERISPPSKHAPQRVGRGGKNDDISAEEAVVTCRQFRFSLDMCSLQDINLEVGFDYYLRYSYSFFGCPYPVLVQPPLTLHYPGAILDFIKSFCSFDIFVLYKNLEEHVKKYPLTVEVWKVCLDDHDYIAGLVQVPLDKVLYAKKIKLQDGTVRQITKLECPVFKLQDPHLRFSSKSIISDFPPDVTGHLPNLATLNLTLMLEDMGPNPEKIRPIGIGMKLNIETHLETKDIVKSKDYEAKDAVMMRDLDAHSKDMMMKPSPTHQAMGAGLMYQAKEGSSVDGVDKVIRFVADTPEYKVAMELEKWRASEEDAFLEHLKAVEASHMSRLGTELKKRDSQGQELLMKKIDHYNSLEKKLQVGLQKLKKQQKILDTSEDKMAQEKEQHVQEIVHLNNQNAETLRASAAKYEQSLDLGRHRANELQFQMDLMRKQVRELEAKLRTRNDEFEKFQKEVVIPQSKLQGDLNIAQLEKVELERKVSSLTITKENYKKKWKETRSELSKFHHCEQKATREKLLSQDKELAEMHMQHIQHKEESDLTLQIGKVKDDLQRLELKISCEKSIPKVVPSPPHPRSSPTPSAVTNENKALTADVARWIEERDILLHTGLYLNTDLIIQNLDLKIETAMLKIST